MDPTGVHSSSIVVEVGIRLGIRLVVLQLVASLIDSSSRCGGGENALQIKALEPRQRAAFECSGECGAASISDSGVVEVELLELRQYSTTGGGIAPAGGGGARRAARPSLPNELPAR